MYIVTYRKVFYAIAALLVVGSIGVVFVKGLNYSIDFKGGTIIEAEYTGERPSRESVLEVLKPLDLSESVRETGDKGFLIRSRAISNEERVTITSLLKGAEIKRFDSIGPVLGKEAARSAYASILLVLVVIVLFIAYAFRHVSRPISSWQYGFVAIIALVHDVIIPVGVFAFLGYEVDTLFVTALLVILGFSIHDTIVVFDRVRENLRNQKKESFTEIVGNSISQTFARSINTSLTTLMALVALYIYGGEATHKFALALLIGITAGTYSSIFIGSPLLVTIEKWQNRKK
ncbi:MAG: protein translocase subunit SecF, partial [Candidatus Pacebacteria bacterium]|jgi:preprotein translocase subunit SecF|nr:protein translocase subunit SecF [Candidatus Paceibacterota bacterium]